MTPADFQSAIRNPQSAIYLITDRGQTRGRPLLDVLEEALEGGVGMIQLREKDLTGKALCDLAWQVMELTKKYGARLLINDRIDVALAVGADGVHLPGGSFTPGKARTLLGMDKIIAVSTHSLSEAAAAQEDGADFVTFSPIYHTSSKAIFGKPQGLLKLNEVCAKVQIPVYALGGITADRIPEVMSMGACGAAMISAILSAKDVGAESFRMVKRAAYQ